MRKVVSLLALTLTVCALSSQAQAVFTECSLDFQGKNGNFLFVDGSYSKGTMTCVDALGNEKSEKVRVKTIGLAADINLLTNLKDLKLFGRCDIAGSVQMVGVGLTWNSLFDIFALAEVNSIVENDTTYSGAVSMSASPILIPQNVQAVAGTITYGKSCKRLAGVKLGSIITESEYQQRKKANMMMNQGSDR